MIFTPLSLHGRAHFGAAKFLTRMLSLILRRNFFWVWTKKIFFWRSFWDHMLVSIAIFKNFRCFRYFKNCWKDWIPYAHAPTFMRTLSIRVRNSRACWACASGTDAFAEHMRQELVRALSIRVRVLMPDRAQSLQNMLSIRIRNWYAPWAYESGTDACTEHTHPDAHAQHAHQKLNDA